MTNVTHVTKPPRPANRALTRAYVESRHRFSAFAAILALIGALGVSAAPASHAVQPAKVTLQATAPKTTITRGAKATIKVVFKKKGKPVTKASVRLQKYDGGKWKNTSVKATIAKGKASIKVKPAKTSKYRIKQGSSYSKSITIKVKASVAAPSKLTAARAFTINGSGFGHGVGMSQFGAYERAREGDSAATILRAYYTGAKVQTIAVPARIGVQVFGPEPYSFSGYADSANTTTFSVDRGRWRVVDPEGNVIFPSSGIATKGMKLKLSISGSRVKADVTGSSLTPLSWTADGMILQWSGTDEFPGAGTAAVAKITGANGTYRHGVLKVSAIDKRLNIVNDLPLNEYLYGIAEMPSSWGSAKNQGAAALSAQAITARSYALVRMRVTAAKPQGKLKAKCNCHLVDDVRDQNYTGWNKENETVGTTNYGAIWKAAVDATISGAQAQVLTHKNAPIATYYYSSSGGATANSEDVWATPVDYLKSVDDAQSLRAPGNAMASWTRTIAASRVASVFGLPNVAKLEVTERYASGQAKTLRATSTSGKTATYTAKADVVRSRLGSMPSSWFTSITPTN
ncbi:SpoIID/LytB domain protein [Rarobacter faecitabidus]|uniref:SpoIID/LytB domain protein n=1 Tax=Rarobacter faecitabidus TaxID=13243 RepID=A0A542ZUH8_RARFA|nr:SpoIID/LytB domain protein [Rarobacter faecitabidus]